MIVLIFLSRVVVGPLSGTLRLPSLLIDADVCCSCPLIDPFVFIIICNNLIVNSMSRLDLVFDIVLVHRLDDIFPTLLCFIDFYQLDSHKCGVVSYIYQKLCCHCVEIWDTTVQTNRGVIFGYLSIQEIPKNREFFRAIMYFINRKPSYIYGQHKW